MLYLPAFALVVVGTASPSSWSAGSSRSAVEAHADGFDAHMARVAAKGWVLSSSQPALPSELVRLVVAVKQDGVDALAAAALEVSDPTSGAGVYGRHLTNEAVHALVAPRAHSLAAVRGWLASAGIAAPEALTPNSDFLGASVPLSAAEALLNTTYGAYVHAATGQRVLRVSAPYSLPSAVAAEVDFVAPTMSFYAGGSGAASASASSSRAAVAASGGQSGQQAMAITRIGPAYLRKIYGMTDADVGRGAASNNSMAVASFIQQFYSHTDLTAFLKKYPVSLHAAPAAPPTPARRRTAVR